MHEKLQKLMTTSEEICKIKETLTCWLKEEVNLGKDNCHLKSSGDVTDMIKDLAETEKECAEALYYYTVIKAMLEGEEPSYGDSMGYNHRHLRSGRFAPSGEGHRVNGSHNGSYGFHPGPFVDQEEYIDAYLYDPSFKAKMRPSMGYNDGMDRDWNDTGSKYGRDYDNYKAARRHYTTSNRPEDKERMDQYALSHVDNALESVKDLWDSSDDVMLKKRIVDEASKVLNHMKADMAK